MYGGSMFNNVVDAILSALWQLGYSTLRFNFRGVGASEGEHDGGRGERDDAAAAMTYLLSQPGVRKDGAGVPRDARTGTKRSSRLTPRQASHASPHGGMASSK